MKRTQLSLQSVAGAIGLVMAIGAATSASAQSITMTGNYVQTAVNNRGTLGSGGSTSPGLKHDPTGTGTFGVNDYLTPGSPHEGYSINSVQTGFRQADNNGASGFGTAAPTTLTGAAAMGYANAVSWSGQIAGLLGITNSYFFNAGDERVKVVTTLTALSDLSSLAFGRGLDPDPDVNTFGSFSTNNQRGNTLFGLADFVGAAGSNTGLTVALVNGSGNTYTHNTLIGSSCCSNIDPYAVLGGSGATSNSGDFSINMAWRIGDLLRGNSATLTYYYAVGDRIASTGGGTGAVPEPATWAMMIVGMFAVAGALRHRAKPRVSLTYA